MILGWQCHLHCRRVHPPCSGDRHFRRRHPSRFDCSGSRFEFAVRMPALAMPPPSPPAPPPQIRVVPSIARTVAAMVATHRCALQSETAAIVDPATITALAAAKSSVAGNVGTDDAVGNKQGSCVVDAATRSACGAFTILISAPVPLRLSLMTQCDSDKVPLFRIPPPGSPGSWRGKGAPSGAFPSRIVSETRDATVSLIDHQHATSASCR